MISSTAIPNLSAQSWCNGLGQGVEGAPKTPRMMQLVTDLDQLYRLAQARADEFDVLRWQLQLDDAITDAELDAWVERVAAPIVAAIDCTQCANCCRMLTVGLEPPDLPRLAQGVDLPEDQMIAQYVDFETAAQVDEWAVLRHKPCAFLHGRKCTIYAHRPLVCRLYPQFTPDFRWTLEQMTSGAALCPIVYNVLDAVLAREAEIYQL